MILVIDDDGDWSNALVQYGTRRTSFAWHSVADGMTALAYVTSHGSAIQGVVLDLRMHMLDGRTVAILLRHYLPRVPILPISSEDPATFVDMSALGCVPGLRKQDIELLPTIAYIAAMCAMDCSHQPMPPAWAVHQARAQYARLCEAEQAQPHLMSALLRPVPPTSRGDGPTWAIPVEEGKLMGIEKLLAEALQRSSSRPLNRAVRLLELLRPSS